MSAFKDHELAAMQLADREFAAKILAEEAEEAAAAGRRPGLVARMIAAEVSARVAPDGRRLIRDARMALQVARSADAISARVSAGEYLLREWT